MSFASLTAGQAILGASALSTGGNILSGLLGESAAQTAAQQATAGELTGIGAAGGAEANAFNVYKPLYAGELGNFDILDYLLTNQLPQAPTVPAGLYAQIGAITGGPAPTDPNAALNLINTWQSQYPAWAAQHPNAGTEGGTSNYAQAQSISQQLQQYQAQQQAYNAAMQSIASLPNNLQGGSLLTMLSNPFSYNVATDPSFNNAANWENSNLASVFAQGGQPYSGNMASAINQEDLGTLEPTYEGQAFQNWQANNPAMAQNIINALEGNVGGAAQNTATALGNLYTGTGTDIANLAGQIGQTQASGTMAGNNALTNMISNMGNTLNTGVGQYLNASLLSQILANQQNAIGGGLTLGGGDISNLIFGGGINDATIPGYGGYGNAFASINPYGV